MNHRKTLNRVFAIICLILLGVNIVLTARLAGNYYSGTFDLNQGLWEVVKFYIGMPLLILLVFFICFLPILLPRWIEKRKKKGEERKKKELVAKARATELDDDREGLYELIDRRLEGGAADRPRSQN